MKKFIKEVVHNCLVHPVLPFLPKKWAKALHDVNANWAFPPAKLQPVFRHGRWGQLRTGGSDNHV